MSEVSWDASAQDIFNKIIGNLPEFHRSIAKRLVKESAEKLARERGLKQVEEKELIETFFKEIPPAFKTMMIRLFDRLKINYTPYVNE